MTLDQISKDGIEVAKFLCHTLNKRKIILLGHSWGSIVAVKMVTLNPTLFAAYVGTGQVESWGASVNFQFDLLFAKARREGDEATIKQFEAIGRPDTKDAKQYFTFTKTLRDAMAHSDQKWLQSLRANGPALQANDPKNFQEFLDGFNFSAEHLLADQMTTDLRKSAPELHTAFFLIQGKDDVVTPTQAAVDYYKKVKAPTKELILIPDAGHFVFMTASDNFLVALTKKVRPVAIRAGA
jgi:pimeloyl-ACP methyl ester carboxylesterase